MCLKNRNYLLVILVFSLSFLSLLMLFSTNTLAININVPYEWYRYQGAPDSSNPSTNSDCGPTGVAMAIQFVKNVNVPIKDICNYISNYYYTGVQPGSTNSGELVDCLQIYGISYNALSPGVQSVIDAVNNRSHIVLCFVTMGSFGKGPDIDGASSNPAFNYDRYHSYSDGHVIIVKGISNDGQWIIAYDPNVFGSYPYAKYWYSNGVPKGKERYYRVSEFINALQTRGYEITGSTNINMSSKFNSGDQIRVKGSVLNIRPGPGLNMNQQPQQLSLGDIGQVVADGKNGILVDDYNWWHVQFGNRNGWCAETGLEKVGPSPLVQPCLVQPSDVNTDRIYWLQNNKLYWITAMDIINKMANIPKWGDKIGQYPSSQLNGYSGWPGDINNMRFIAADSRSNGLLISLNGSGTLETDKIYVMENGKRKHLISPSSYEPKDIIEVSQEILNLIPESDTTPPTVNAFSVTPSSVTLGNSFTISYTVSDSGSSGLKQVELWRANDSGGTPVSWAQIKTNSASGNGPLSGLFNDVPSSVGSFWYGVHVVDNSGNWNDERNSNTVGPPNVFNPVKVTVSKIQYTLTANPDPQNGGNITPNPSGGIYDDGTQVTIKAIANNGYRFIGWSGDASGSDTSFTLTMNSNKIVTGRFTKIQYTLTANPDPQNGGNITPDPSGGIYDDGTQVTLTAIPSSGFMFVEWSGSGDFKGSVNPITVKMDSSKIITALFTLIDSVKRVLTIIGTEASPNTRINVEVSISDTADLASGDIVIKYDANVLTIEEVKGTALLSEISLAVNKEILNELKISMAGAKGISSGNGAIINIGLTVNPKASVGTETKLEFVTAEVYDESGKPIPIKLEDGFVGIKQACVKGDVNNDGNIKSNDAILILRIAAGLLEPNDYQKCAADVNGDGNIRSNDATIVLRKAAGLEAPVRYLIADRHISISFLVSPSNEEGAKSEAHGLKGEIISVPIMVDNIDILSSGDMSISYDSRVLRAIDVLVSPSNEEGTNDGLLMADNISQPGLIRISFAGVERLNNGKLAEIKFEVLTDDVSPLIFKMAELYSPDALPLISKVTNKQFKSWAVASERSALLQNYPNPFNPETWIPYQLHEANEVVIRIYNITGELVREIRLGYKPAGQYTIQDRSAYWDGRNEAGERVSSGVYFYNIQAGKYSATMKMILTK